MIGQNSIGSPWFIQDSDNPNLFAGTALYIPVPDYEPISISAKFTKIECEYCGQANNPDREQCWGCGAPLK